MFFSFLFGKCYGCEDEEKKPEYSINDVLIGKVPTQTPLQQVLSGEEVQHEKSLIQQILEGEK